MKSFMPFSMPRRCRLLLAAATILLLPACAFAQAFVEGNTFFMRGDLRYKPGKIVIDTVSVVDETGFEQFEAREDDAFPSEINGRRVYEPMEVDEPVIFAEKVPSQQDFLLDRMRGILMATEFYEYGASARLNLRNIIVDERGKVIFYQFYGMRSVTADNRVKPLRFPELTAAINKFMTELPPIKPAKVDGKPVMSYADIDFHHIKIEKVGSNLIYSYDGNVYPE